jgi:two-component system, NtrC family, sensor kinase
MARTKAVIHVEDLTADAAYADRNPTTVAAVELGGVRTYLAVPMLKDDELIGGFALCRQEVRPFTDKQIALVTSFVNLPLQRSEPCKWPKNNDKDATRQIGEAVC